MTPRPALRGDGDVDVAIVGGGFTGLWTARELLRREPGLRVAVLERSVCGFGASGRNGGWASAYFPAPEPVVVRRYGLDAFTHQRHVLQDAVVTLGAAADHDGIDASYVRGGTVKFARSGVQAERLRRHVAQLRELGVSEDDVNWLDADAAREHGTLSETRGALFSPHCARINPARLVRGLAAANERLGASIYEDTAVARIVAGRRGRRPQVVSVGGTLRADYVVRATEGFTPTLAGQRRTIVPIYSLMVATEPLPSAFWDEAGFAARETFSDDRHLIIYGQRTDDDRIAFGGRGSPYHFASTVEERFDRNPKVFAMLEATLRDLFPSLDGALTHRWGGPLAMPRDHFPSVLVDHATGLASAGGYTGDGVVLSHVCANALADLITSPGADTGFTRLGFVQQESRRWELEPGRWLGINLGLSLAAVADRHERRRDAPSRAGAWLERLMG